jgi:curved DNA-binding protein CbpA
VTAQSFDKLDYYRVLGLERKATAPQIKDAFRKIALDAHPDRLMGETPDLQARGAALYRRASEAYRVLSDPQKRKEYDVGLAEGKLRYPLAQRPKPAASMPPGAKGASVPPGTKGATVPPEPPKPAPIKDAAKPFLKQAESAATEGKWQMAVLHMQMALRHDPQHPTLRARLAELEKKQKGG